MKKKLWITILIILAAAGVAIAAYFIWFHKEYVQPEVDEPEVFHDIEFDADLLIGVWREDEVYYRYNDDGTAVTWDLADDVQEDEGTQMTWTLEGDTFTHYYVMEIGGIIPKVFNMKVLEFDLMKYDDDFGVNHTFTKVEELQLLN